MSLKRLLEHVPVTNHPTVERLYAVLVRAKGKEAAELIPTFARALYERGLISSEGLSELTSFAVPYVSAIDDELEPQPSRYHLSGLLGQGAMGEVYLGRDSNLKRHVAVKRVHAGLRHEPKLIKRFINEAQITAQLDHPAIIPVYGLEQDADGALSYAMKLVRGVTLSAFLEETRRQIRTQGAPAASHSLKARIGAFVSVLNAVAYAHRRGVIHRDLKPDNIMVGAFGEVLVMDWGLARLAGHDGDHRVATGSGPDEVPGEGASAPAASGDDSADSKLTRAGAVLGTPAYMSPEQASGERLDAASDQYSLGLILYEVATLRMAMSASSAETAIAKAAHAMNAPIGESPKRIPRELRAIITKATARDKAARYPSVADLADDLNRFLRDESVLADPDRGLRHATRWIVRHRQLAIASAVGLVFLAMAVVIFAAWRGETALESEREAARRREQALSSLSSLVGGQAARMNKQLGRYEALLAGIVATAALVLTEPAPPSEAVAYQYAGGRRDPEAIPSYAVASKRYRQPASIRADFPAAVGVDRAALRWRIDQLARLEPTLRSALLLSAGHGAAELPLERAERLVLETGVGLIWTYVAAVEGVGISMPGVWQYQDSPAAAGYDQRHERWYSNAIDTHGPRWGAIADESGLGLTINCAQTIRDRDGTLLGVAALDIWLTRFVTEVVEIQGLKGSGADHLLLDAHDRVVVRASAVDGALKVTDYMPTRYEEPEIVAALDQRATGHLVLADGRLALWTAVGDQGMTYLAIGPEEALMRSVGYTAP